MKKSFFIFMLAGICCSGLVPVNAFGFDKRDYVHVPPLHWKAWVKEGPYVFLEDTSEVRLNDDWSIDETQHYRIKVQKEVAKELGEQEIYYDKSREEITELEAFVETPEGQKFPYTKVQDLDVYEGIPMYSDMRVKVITLPQVNVGSIIDVKVTSKIKRDIMPDNFARQELYPSIPHAHYKSTYIFPKDKKIFFKPYNAVEEPKKIEADDTVTYIFEYTRTAPLAEIESFLPPYTELFGISSFSSLAEWKDLVDWYRDLIKKNTIEDPEITQKTQKIIEGKNTQREKAEAILEFLQDNFRYVSMSFGDNTVEPHPTKEIFSNRYGDCKDWSLLARQMLGIAGIPARICLFNDEFAGDPDWGLPCVSAFDHVILEIIADGTSYFADPQLKYYHPGQFPQSYNNAALLVIEEDSYRFEKIKPVEQKFTNNIFKIYTYLSETGSARYAVTANIDLDMSNQLRHMWSNMPQSGRDQFLDTLEARFARGGKFTDYKFGGIEKRYGGLTVTLDINAPQAYQMTNDMLILSDPVDQYFPNPFIETKRKFPLFLPAEQFFKIIFVYMIPEGFKVDYIPENLNLDNDIMRLTRKVEQDKGILYVFYGFNLKRGRLAVNRYWEIQKLWADYHKEIKNAVILKKTP